MEYAKSSKMKLREKVQKKRMDKPKRARHAEVKSWKLKETKRCFTAARMSTNKFLEQFMCPVRAFTTMSPSTYLSLSLSCSSISIYTFSLFIWYEVMCINLN